MPMEERTSSKALLATIEQRVYHAVNPRFLPPDGRSLIRRNLKLAPIERLLRLQCATWICLFRNSLQLTIQAHSLFSLYSVLLLLPVVILHTFGREGFSPDLPPVFIPNPPLIHFRTYKIGDVYEVPTKQSVIIIIIRSTNFRTIL